MKVTYDSLIYNSRQLWGLVRDLTANGWAVCIQCDEDTRKPGTPNEPNKYLCIVKHDGWECFGYPLCQRRGDTPWIALAKAVNEIIIPAESGFPPKDDELRRRLRNSIEMNLFMGKK